MDCLNCKFREMKENSVGFFVAKLAKEKGFPQEPNRRKVPYYNYKGEFNGDVTDFLRKYLREEDTSDVESVSAPTQSLLAKWLREKHNIHLIAYKNINIDGYDWCYITTDGITNINSYKTYEEAYEIGLQEALKLIK